MEKENTTVGTLRTGLRIGDEVHTEFELRELTSGDLFAAEASADSSRPITYRAALLAQQLIRIGSFNGPFTLGMLAKLKPSDLMKMQEAQAAMDAQGEAVQPG